MQITKVKQHYIDWGDSSLEQFIAAYRVTPKASLRKLLIESINMQTNDEWLAARHGHITASNMSKFLSGGRSKTENLGETSKGIINKYMQELRDPCFDDMESKVETYQMKQGLIFEKRAIELFEKAINAKVNTDIGFISEEINGINFGVSLDGHIGEEDEIDAIVEVKCRTGAEYLAEREKLGNKETIDQMQGGMTIAKCPRAFMVLYDIANDRIQYLKWTRGLEFAKRLQDQIVFAKNYIARQSEFDQYINLTDKIMSE